MSERITRKSLRSDGFAVAVEHNVEYMAAHRSQLIRYGAIALVVIAVAVGIYYFRNHEKIIRENQLADAIQIQETPVTPGAQPGPNTYLTEDAKRAAAIKGFTDVATKFSGSREGWIAEYYLGCIAADAGKLDEAQKRFQSVAGAADKDYASLARLSLADIDYLENRSAEGEKILRDLIDHPTILVSKDQATISLARHLARTNPAAAKKLVDPLVNQPNAVSQAAIQVLSDLKQ